MERSRPRIKPRTPALRAGASVRELRAVIRVFVSIRGRLPYFEIRADAVNFG